MQPPKFLSQLSTHCQKMITILPGLLTIIVLNAIVKSLVCQIPRSIHLLSCTLMTYPASATRLEIRLFSFLTRYKNRANFK